MTEGDIKSDSILSQRRFDSIARLSEEYYGLRVDVARNLRLDGLAIAQD